MAILKNRDKVSGSVILDLIKYYISIIKYFAVFVLLIFSVSFLYLARNSWSFSDKTLDFFSPIVAATNSLYDNTIGKIHTIGSDLVYSKDLKTENMELKLAVINLKKHHEQSLAIEAENNSLKRMLNVPEVEGYDKITARTLFISLNPFSKSAIIGAGVADGVEIDQVVVNEQGLVGKIIETGSNYSKVSLISDSSCRVPVMSAVSRSKALMSSEASSMILNYLPEDHGVELGEKIVTSGDGKIYPYGIDVARVVNVEGSWVELEPIIDFSKLDFVTIYRAYKKD